MMHNVLSSSMSQADEKQHGYYDLHSAAPQSGNSAGTNTATDAAIDAYASKVLTAHSPPEACIEQSLGPYIASIFRSSSFMSSDSSPLSYDFDVATEIEEYASILELLQEHCSMDEDTAQSALKRIAASVKTGTVDPFGEDVASSMAHSRSSSHSGGQSHSFVGLGSGSLAGSLGGLGNSLNALSVGGNSNLASSFGGRGYRSASIGEEADVVDDPVQLLGKMLNDGTSGLGGGDSAGPPINGPQLGSAALARNSSSDSNENDPPLDAQSSFVLDEELPGYEYDGGLGGNLDVTSMSQVMMSRTPGSSREKNQTQAGGQNDAVGGTAVGYSTLTPLKEDNLIPLDLLGALDDPATSAPGSPEASSSAKPQTTEEKKDDAVTVVELAAKMAKRKDGVSGRSNVDDGTTDFFPSIAESASVKDKETNGLPPTSKKGGAKSSKKKSKKKQDLDLAASLFQSARGRSNSIPTEKSPMLKPMVATDTLSSSFGGTGSMVTGGSTPLRAASAGPNQSLLHQQIESTAEILLTMNGALGEEAAYEAALISNSDINIAQYVIDGAMGAPPVCRHLLNGGCYRSDCQFSHDVDGHTCLFWLRGRCNKGEECQFLHGFCAKLLEGINTDYLLGPTQHNVSAPFSQARPLGAGAFTSSPFASPGLKPAAPGLHGADNFSLPGADNYFSLSGADNFSLSVSAEGQQAAAPAPGATAPSTSASFSFANVASTGYSNGFSFSQPEGNPADGSISSKARGASKQFAKIPHNLWQASENRDSSVFHITDPIERYYKVMASNARDDVIDLHFQSVKTFPIVLSEFLEEMLLKHCEVWVVTGSGHHVDKASHQKRGGVLEDAVNSWLDSEGYEYYRGRDRNGHGGAVLVKRQQQ